MRWTAGQPPRCGHRERALDALANATNATNATASQSPPSPAPPLDDEQVLSELAAADINVGRQRLRQQQHEVVAPAAARVAAVRARVRLPFAMTSHALFYLLRHWSVSFRAKVFSPATKVAAGCHVHFVPMAHKGKQALVPLARSPRTGELTCEFQRQRYSHKSADDAKPPPPRPRLDGPTAAADAIVLVRGCAAAARRSPAALPVPTPRRRRANAGRTSSRRRRRDSSTCTSSNCSRRSPSSRWAQFPRSSAQFF